MAYQRERYEQWIRDFLERRHPELVSRFREILDAFESTVASGTILQQQLATISDGVRSRSRPLAENAAILLGELAARFPQARELIKGLSRDPSLQVRVNALIALGVVAPGELHEEVLRGALRDRSPKLRTLAADKIVQLGMKSLLSDLEQAAAEEADPKTRESLECERDLLRDGFCARRQNDNRTWITCRLPDGSLKSSFVDSGDVERIGLRAIAESLGATV